MSSIKHQQIKLKRYMKENLLRMFFKLPNEVVEILKEGKVIDAYVYEDLESNYNWYYECLLIKKDNKHYILKRDDALIYNRHFVMQDLTNHQIIFNVDYLNDEKCMKINKIFEDSPVIEIIYKIADLNNHHFECEEELYKKIKEKHGIEIFENFYKKIG